jgi:hypothetical protein
VPQLHLYQVRGGRKEAPWLFSFDGEGVTLFSDDNQPVVYFPHEMANDRIILPSFWDNIAQLGVIADDGTKIWFTPEKQTVAKIKVYLNWTLAIQGPEFINRLKKEAKTNWYWGLGFVAL